MIRPASVGVLSNIGYYATVQYTYLPASAEQWSTVSFKIVVHNTSPEDITFRVYTRIFKYPDMVNVYAVNDQSRTITRYTSVSFDVSFGMPSNDAAIYTSVLIPNGVEDCNASANVEMLPYSKTIQVTNSPVAIGEDIEFHLAGFLPNTQVYVNIGGYSGIYIYTSSVGMYTGTIGGTSALAGPGTYILYAMEVETEATVYTGFELVAGPSNPVFALATPTADPHSGPPGPVTITCPFTLSGVSSPLSFQVKVNVYEGSVLPGSGTLIWTDTKNVQMSNGSHSVQFLHTSTQGSIDRRDVGVEIWVAGVKVKDEQWDDIFHVTSGQVTPTFSLEPPTADPYSAVPGIVVISCPVIVQNAPSGVQIQVKVNVYEGSMLPGAGTLLWSDTKSLGVTSGRQVVSFSYTSTQGTIDRRDVGVEVWYNGQKVSNDQWDDIFFVTPTPTSITGVDLTTVQGDYRIGDYVDYNVAFKYQGPAQKVEVKLTIGKGILFTEVVELDPVDFDLPHYDTPTDVETVNGEFKIPSGVVEGQSYSLRVAMTTVDGETAGDDMYGAFHVIVTDHGGGAGAGGYLSGVGANTITGINITLGSGDIADLGLHSTSRKDIPVAGLSTGDCVQIMCLATNISLADLKFRLHWKVTKPQGGVIEADDSPSWTVSNGELVNFIDPTSGVGSGLGPGSDKAIYLRETGEYTLSLKLYNATTGAELDSFDGVLITGVKQGAGNILNDIGNIIPLMLMMMIMSMMMEMMSGFNLPEGAPPPKKPVTEAVVGGVKKAGGVVKKVVEYFAPQEEVVKYLSPPEED